ncbi:MAG TPA: sulfurtransferase complex subunit TusD [Spongiibacteraceae bacterium]|nr:sulfurtransferase complex subunit TusD [Spongiibacteraceae bacterium]
MTTFALMVLGAPLSTQSAHTALAFAQAAVQAGHQVTRVFFYHDGVYCANALAIPPSGETSIAMRWSELAQAQQIDLVVCVASAVKRGLLDSDEAKRHQKGAGNIQPGFELSGLGQWVEACLLADRVVTFGA